MVTAELYDPCTMNLFLKYLHLFHKECIKDFVGFSLKPLTDGRKRSVEPKATNNCSYCCLCSGRSTTTIPKKEKGKEDKVDNK